MPTGANCCAGSSRCRPPRQVFLTHGEPASAAALAQQLHRERGWNTLVPQFGQTVELS